VITRGRWHNRRSGGNLHQTATRADESLTAEFRQGSLTAGALMATDGKAWAASLPALQP
jgi:hypothetical protein